MYFYVHNTERRGADVDIGKTWVDSLVEVSKVGDKPHQPYSTTMWVQRYVKKVGHVTPLSGFVPIFVQPSPSSSGRPHLRLAIPIFVRPDPPDPPDLTSLCLILFMNSRMFSFHNRMSLHMLFSSTFYLLVLGKFGLVRFQAIFAGPETGRSGP